MIHKTFAIYDSKAGIYLHVMNFRRTEEAIRSFSVSCSNSDTDFYKYAEDYSLFEIGTFDDEKGLHSPYSSPLHIRNATQCSPDHSEYYATINQPKNIVNMN